MLVSCYTGKYNDWYPMYQHTEIGLTIQNSDLKLDSTGQVFINKDLLVVKNEGKTYELNTGKKTIRITLTLGIIDGGVVRPK